MSLRIGRRLRAAWWRTVLRAADRRFIPRLRHDPAGPVLVLSPHLDDAVLDCWSVLSSAHDVRVVTVFAGEPAPGTLIHWDRLARAKDSAELMRARREEDGAALARAGRSPHHLSFPPDPFRPPGDRPRMAALDAALAGEVPAASRVFAPAVLGVVHPDHLVVRDYALRLASAGIPVELYADVPYAVQFGWPPWVSGDDPDPHLDPEVAWRACPADLPNLLTRERARVAALDPGTAAAKLEAMRCYASQFAMLDQGPVGRMRNPRIHGFEVFWPARG